MYESIEYTHIHTIQVINDLFNSKSHNLSLKTNLYSWNFNNDILTLFLIDIMKTKHKFTSKALLLLLRFSDLKSI